MIFHLLKAILVLIWLTCLSISAQVSKDTLKYSSTLTIGGRIQDGVFTQTLITTHLHTSLRQSHWKFFNETSYTYNVVNGNQLSDDWASVSVFSWEFSRPKQINPTLIHVHKNNLLYRVNRSNRYLAGVSITPLKKQEQFWFFVGGGIERTHYDGEVFQNSPLSGPIREFPVATVYLENEHHFFKDRLFFKYDIFYIQSLEESRDFTFWIVPSMNVAITKNILFGINYDYRFRNVHLMDISNINELLTFNVKISGGN